MPKIPSVQKAGWGGCLKPLFLHVPHASLAAKRFARVQPPRGPTAVLGTAGPKPRAGLGSDCELRLKGPGLGLMLTQDLSRTRPIFEGLFPPKVLSNH